jgi:hypothetical protein
MVASETQSDRRERMRSRVYMHVFCSNTPEVKLFIYAAVRTLQAGLSEFLGFHLFLSIRDVYGIRARNRAFGSIV